MNGPPRERKGAPPGERRAPKNCQPDYFCERPSPSGGSSSNHRLLQLLWICARHLVSIDCRLGEQNDLLKRRLERGRTW